MKAGDTWLEFAQLLTDGSGPIVVADVAAYKALGFDLLFTLDGVLITPAFTVTPTGITGWHLMRWTATEGDYLVETTIPALHDANPPFVAAYIDSVDLSDVFAAVNSGGELTPIKQNRADQSLGNLIDGDAFCTGPLTVPLSILTPCGLTDLTGTTITAAFREDPSTAPVAITASIDDAANRIISAKMDPFLSAMSLGAGATDLSKTWFLDIQIKVTATGTILTVGRYKVDVIWQRDETL